MNTKVEFLFLSQEDMIEAGVLDMKGCVDTMETVFRLMDKKDCLMGGASQESHGLNLWFPKSPPCPGSRIPLHGPDRRYMCMTGYLGGEFDVCGVKYYGSNVENPAKRGLPRSVLMITLNDPESGAPLAVMDGNLVSAMRTGAAIGLGAKYLSVKNAGTAGIIAAGVIARTTIMAVAAAVPSLKTIKVFDIDLNKARVFSKEMSAELGIDVVAVPHMEDAVKDSDIVSSATSGTTHPFFKKEWFKPGAFLGLPAEVDFEEQIWTDSTIVADRWKMHLEFREESRNAPEDLRTPQIHGRLHELIMDGKIRDSGILDLGPIVTGAQPFDREKLSPTIFVTGGLPLEDLGWATTVYRQARNKGLGQTLKLWDTPYWY